MFFLVSAIAEEGPLLHIPFHEGVHACAAADRPLELLNGSVLMLDWHGLPIGRVLEPSLPQLRLARSMRDTDVLIGQKCTAEGCCGWSHLCQYMTSGPSVSGGDLH